jgi:hypothetical protein
MSFSTARRSQVAVALAALIVAVAPYVHAQQATATRGATRPMQSADLKAWKNIRQSVLSNDGKWFAYIVAPNEGDASVVIRSTGADAKEMKFPIGDPGGAGGGRGGAPGAPGAAGGPLAISGDSRWVAFTVYPPAATAGARGGRGGRGGGGGGGAAQAATPTPPAQN